MANIPESELFRAPGLLYDHNSINPWTGDKLNVMLMNFGNAIVALKNGQLVARSGWNGKGMFIFMRPADELQIDFLIEKVKSLPQRLKDYYKALDSKEDPSEQGLSKIKFGAYLCMKAADGSIVNGWLASQTDILAEDWEIVE